MSKSGSRRFRLRLAAVLATASALSSCRHLSPVERHFLRMPPDCAGGLSRIERAQWLKANRRHLPSRKLLRESGHFSLANTATKRGTMLRWLEILHVPNPDGSGGLAIVTLSGNRAPATPQLHLIEHQRFVYTDVTDRVIGTPASSGGWAFSPERRIIGEYQTGRARGRRISWNGSTWTAH